VLLGSFGQILLKVGTNIIGSIELRDIFSAKFFSIISNPYIFSGVLMYAIAMLLWFVIISQVEISFVYPLISITYIVVALIAWVFLGESLTMIKFFGILLIIGGVYLVLLKI